MRLRQSAHAPRQLFTLTLTLALLCVGVPRPASAEPEDKPLAEIGAILIDEKPETGPSVPGQVEITSAKTGAPKPAKVGAQLFAGDVVTTGDRAKVSLLFPQPEGGGRIEVLLKNRCKVKVSSAFAYWGTLFITGVGLFNTKTKYVRLGKRGTEFEINVTEGGDVDLKVLRGKVDVERGDFGESPAAGRPAGRGGGRRETAARLQHSPQSLPSRPEKTVGALQRLEIKKDEPLAEPRPLPTPEAAAALDWTDDIIIASKPKAAPRNILPTFASPEAQAQAFKAARRKAVLDKDASSLKTLGDVYKDWGEGERAAEQYDEAAQLDARLRESLDFLADELEAARLASNTKKTEELALALSQKAAAEPETSKAAARARNALGNVYYDQAIQSIVRKEWAAANTFFTKSQSAYASAGKGQGDDAKAAEVIRNNLRNVKLAFGPDPAITVPGQLNLTGTYRGFISFPLKEIYQQPGVLVITGNRFKLQTCDDSLAGNVVVKNNDPANPFIDFVFDAPTGFQTLSLSAKVIDENDLRLSGLPGETIPFAFSTAKKPPAKTCFRPYGNRPYGISSK